MLKNITFLVAFFLFAGCTSSIHKNTTSLPTSKTYAIGAFVNYSQTPMAGLSAASIVESVLAEQNIVIHSLVQGSEEVKNKLSQKELFELQKREAQNLGADYFITGNVQEWRYKTGIDGEPVVSYSLKVLDLKNSAILFNAVGAKSSWGHKSIGVVAQEIAKELIPKFIQ